MNIDVIEYIGKTSLPESTMSNAYWFNGYRAIDVSSDKHISKIIENPELFGITEDEIRKIYAKYGEKFGLEGKAREEIIKAIAQNGWIRIRHYIHPQDYWSIQCDSIPLRRDRIKDFCYWAIEHKLMGYHDDVVLLGYNNPQDKEVFGFHQGGVENLLSESILRESSWSRVVSYIKSGSTFATISAYRGDSPINGWRETYPDIEATGINILDKEAHQQLKEVVKALGYGYVEMKSVYDMREERSLFIPYITREQAIGLGTSFNQQSIVYKDKDFFGLISTIAYNDNAIGDVEMTFNTVRKETPDGEDIITFNPEVLKYANSMITRGTKHQRKQPFAFVAESTVMYELTTLNKYHAIKAMKENRDIQIWKQLKI